MDDSKIPAEIMAATLVEATAKISHEPFRRADLERAVKRQLDALRSAGIVIVPPSRIVRRMV
jgi:hypothetical protein